MTLVQPAINKVIAVAKGVRTVSIQTLAHSNPMNRSLTAALAATPWHVTLPRQGRGAVRRAASTPGASPHRHAETLARISPSKLEEVEDRLLAEAIGQHPHLETALDGALDDMAVLSAELRRSRRRPLLLRSTTNLNRVEDLLLEAMLRAHPHREEALNHLLDDVTSGADADGATELARARFDMQIDNDFDGMS